jgi:hypothetical protein
MTEVAQVKDYMPAPYQRIRVAFHWDDVENDFIFLQMKPEGIVVTPLSKNEKETVHSKERIYFYPWTVIDYLVWFTDSEKVRDNE